MIFGEREPPKKKKIKAICILIFYLLSQIIPWFQFPSYETVVLNFWYLQFLLAFEQITNLK